MKLSIRKLSEKLSIHLRWQKEIKAFFNFIASPNIVHSLQYNLLTTSHLCERKTWCFSVNMRKSSVRPLKLIYYLFAGFIVGHMCNKQLYGHSWKYRFSSLKCNAESRMNTITIFDSSGYNALNAFQSGLFSSICFVFIYEYGDVYRNKKFFLQAQLTEMGEKHVQRHRWRKKKQYYAVLNVFTYIQLCLSSEIMAQNVSIIFYRGISIQLHCIFSVFVLR